MTTLGPSGDGKLDVELQALPSDEESNEANESSQQQLAHETIAFAEGNDVSLLKITFSHHALARQ